MIGTVSKLESSMPICFVKCFITRIIIGNGHIGGVVGNVNACAAENFAVKIQVVSRIVLDSVENIRPKITADVRIVIRKLNMLCRVKTETVNAAIHTFLEQRKNICLNIEVGAVFKSKACPDDSG